ncbi:MAG: hypothetical protein IJP82_00315 [Bacteroidaceae bacterium]|nr:hypothetical protein [Bacteroidaceae bacterium]
MDLLKELNTIEGWTLIVAIATLIVTCWAYIYTRRSDRRRVKAEIARKKAMLATLNDNFTMMGVEHTVAESFRVQKSLLQAEIRQLEEEM